MSAFQDNKKTKLTAEPNAEVRRVLNVSPCRSTPQRRGVKDLSWIYQGKNTKLLWLVRFSSGENYIETQLYSTLANFDFWPMGFFLMNLIRMKT